jgi:hypothetical protein
VAAAFLAPLFTGCPLFLWRAELVVVNNTEQTITAVAVDQSNDFGGRYYDMRDMELDAPIAPGQSTAFKVSRDVWDVRISAAQWTAYVYAVDVTKVEVYTITVHDGLIEAPQARSLWEERR